MSDESIEIIDIDNTDDAEATAATTESTDSSDISEEAQDKSLGGGDGGDKPGRKKPHWKDIVRYVIMAVCICVFIVSGIKIIQILKVYRDADKEHESIKNIGYVDPTTKDGESESTSPSEEVPPYVVPFPTIKFDELEAINSDIIGWLELPGVEISFPLLQGEDNDYYLYHTFTKDDSFTGSIFIDYRNNADLSDPHSFIYGHRISNGSVFYPLLEYDKESFYRDLEARNLNYVYIYTRTKVFVYKIFCVTDVTLQENPYAYTLATEENLSEYLEYIKSLELYDTGDVPPEGAHILTLYTCQDPATVSKIRHLTHAYLVDVLDY